MEYIKLNDGNKMPVLGLGTFMLSPDEAENSVYNALKCGYRLIDTANAYLNERAVGRAIKKSGVPRKEIFLESKLWPAVYPKETAIEEMLERLDTDYVDLLLLHQPAGDYVNAYKMMEKAVKLGKVKSIGLSNFEGEPLQKILEVCEIKPAIIQVEAHPYYPQNKLKEVLTPHNIHIQAWYPLGHGDKSLLEEPIFKEIGKKYQKTPAQIILRWHTQIGNIVIPGSKVKEHIIDNANIFDFSLTEEEIKEINKLDKNKRYYIPSEELLTKYANMSLDESLDK